MAIRRSNISKQVTRGPATKSPPKMKPVRMKSGGSPKKSKSRVIEAGNYTKPAMRERLFKKIKAGGKGGKPGQWSARKAQMLAREYKAKGGGYRG